MELHFGSLALEHVTPNVTFDFQFINQNMATEGNKSGSIYPLDQRRELIGQFTDEEGYIHKVCVGK